MELPGSPKFHFLEIYWTFFLIPMLLKKQVLEVAGIELQAGEI
jgi:hypothetical protein